MGKARVSSSTVQARMPLYMRYCSEGMLDISTLLATAEELEQLGVKTNMVLSDAVYSSKGNVEVLYAERMACVSRVGPNRKLFDELVEKHANSLRQAKYMELFENRILYMSRSPRPCRLCLPGPGHGEPRCPGGKDLP
ncbi:MAG: hypothetical protein RBR15_03135 [Sphaerochaeta sp.]|nr:hypothetical protein [Sphaerochaeta sp.]